MEMVDIVDQTNQVVGQVSKEETHQKGLLHRCILAEVIDSEGKWMLVKQADDRQDAGQFVSPVGGHIKAGETEEAALKREAFEELGLRNFTFKRVGEAIFNRFVVGRQENHYFIFYFIYSDQQPTLNHESVGYERFSSEQLQAELTSNPKKFGEAFHFIWNKFPAHFKSEK